MHDRADRAGPWHWPRPQGAIADPAVGLAGCGELVVSFFQRPAQVEDGLALGFEVGLEGGGTGGRAEAAAVECLLAEQFRQAML